MEKDMVVELLNLPLEILTALGSGYMGYVTAYGGIRRGHSGRDTVFVSLAFGLVALLAFKITSDLGHEWLSVLAGVVSALVFAGTWRAFGRRFWYTLLKYLKIHGDDGSETAWETILQDRRLKVTQLSVHTKDGRILYMTEYSPYTDSFQNGMIFGTDGSIMMVVDEEQLVDGTEESRTGIIDAEWGTRMTYIPADQISRINFRNK